MVQRHLKGCAITCRTGDITMPAYNGDARWIDDEPIPAELVNCTTNVPYAAVGTVGGC